MLPYHGLRLSVTIDFPHPSIGMQKIDIDVNESSYARELAPARTFGFQWELDQMRNMGLIRGASLENAIAIGEDDIVNPDGLRYGKELVNHKILDLIGDIYTSGYRILGKIEANKTGHYLNNLLLKEIFSSTDNYAIY